MAHSRQKHSFIWRRLLAAVGKFVVVLAILQGAYLVLANAFLISPLLKYAANANDILKLDYRWALSPWPGKVWVRDLSLRIEDHNVQVLLTIEKGALNVALHQLARHRVYVSHVRAEGVRYKMRHKVSKVGDQAQRLAAYAPIEGFADPPLFTGPKPPELSHEEREGLWAVQVEDVEADAAEIWILEYRYQGQAHASGRFILRPILYLEVDASLELNGGRLSLGDVAVAEKAALKLKVDVTGTDLEKVVDLAILNQVRVDLKGALQGMDLRFIDAYLAQRANFTGEASANIAAVLSKGSVEPGTKLDLEASNLKLSTALGSVRATALSRVSLARTDAQAPVGLEVAIPSLVLERPGAPQATNPRLVDPAAGNPTIDGLAGDIEFTPTLTEPVRIVSMKLSKVQATVPDLNWVKDGLDDNAAPAKSGVDRLRGRSVLEISGQRDEAGRITGAAGFRVSGLELQTEGVSANGNAEFRTRFDAVPGSQASVKFDNVHLGLTRSQLTLAERRSGVVTAAFASNDLVVRGLEPLQVRGTVDLTADSAAALLPLVVESPIVREIQKALLGLKGLAARSAFHLADRQARFELLHARSGNVKAEGFLAGPTSEVAGAFLVSTPLTNIGLRVNPGDVALSFFVSNNWLTAPNPAPKAPTSVPADRGSTAKPTPKPLQPNAVRRVSPASATQQAVSR
jgi:hypothetical protein